MIIEYDMEKEELIHRIQEQTDEFPSLWKRVTLFSKPNSTWASCENSRIRILKVAPGIHSLPQHEFIGKIACHEGKSIIKGCFMLPFFDFLIILIFTFLIIPVALMLTSATSITMELFLELLMVFIVFLIVIILPSRIVYHREERALVEYLKSL